VSHRLIVRRGKLVGCIVNTAFTGGGEHAASGTVSPAVERLTREPKP
jgi:type IV secretion system protein VirB9